MRQRRFTFLLSILVFAIVGTLFWGYFAPKEKTLWELQKKRFQAFEPGDPEYRAFFKNHQSFYRDGKEEQREKLREIQKRIDSDPQSQTLKRTLATYHAWLKTVPGEKSRIDLAKTIDERLEVIRVIKENQDRIQGTTQRKIAKADSETTNLSPTINELAEYLESLDPDRLETLLGHTPGNFLYQLKKEYHAVE